MGKEKNLNFIGSGEGHFASLGPFIFPQKDSCVAASDSSLRGTCMTAAECQEGMGQPDGVCAAGQALTNLLCCC